MATKQVLCISIDRELADFLRNEGQYSRIINELVRVHYEAQKLDVEILKEEDEITAYLRKRLAHNHNEISILSGALDKFKVKTSEIFSRLNYLKAEKNGSI
ncbi:MAG: hypothetical protein AABX63_02055 [Nanoarchaeota archaeon]